MRVPDLARVLAAAGLLASGAGLAASTPDSDQSGSAAQWRTQTLKFDYSGFTTRYTCDGLEDKVRDILLTFGARKGVKVRATGCSDGRDRPSKFAWVSAEFSSLVPATDPAAAGNVRSEWSKVQLAPSRPSFMGAGECELVEQMRDLLQKGFTLRNGDFRTSCVPHQVSVADYAVSAEVLKPAAPVAK
jgi:hypothetical protein